MEIPAVVRNKAREAGVPEWLDELPELVASLAAEWRIEVGDPMGGGTEAFVAEATTAAGEDAVLKLLVPRDGGAARNEITVLRLAGGEGCARLLEADERRHALLVERLGPRMADLGLPVAERWRHLADAAAAVWRPVVDVDLPTGAEKGRWLVEHVERLQRRIGAASDRAVVHALTCVERRIAAHDDARSVLVHGDVHQWNALRAGEGFKLVDPDGLRAEPEYDLGVILREDPDELLVAGEPRRLAELLADHTGADASAVWEWAAIERVSTGLLCETIDLQPVGRRMLAAADRAAAADG